MKTARDKSDTCEAGGDQREYPAHFNVGKERMLRIGTMGSTCEIALIPAGGSCEFGQREFLGAVGLYIGR